MDENSAQCTLRKDSGQAVHSAQKEKKKLSSGFTLAELLITIAILGLLFIMASWNWRTQIGRGYDAKRKADVNRIKTAFEDYYDDKNCYPPEGSLDACGTATLAPYLTQVPCDPTSKKPYRYIPEVNPCKGYRLLAELADKSDPDIVKIGCTPENGCGYGSTYNYGVSSGVPVLGSGPPLGGGTPPVSTPVAQGTSTPTPTPTITGTPTPTCAQAWACTPDGSCNFYCNPVAVGCPVSFPGGCGSACADPANRCPF